MSQSRRENLIKVITEFLSSTDVNADWKLDIAARLCSATEEEKPILAAYFKNFTSSKELTRQERMFLAMMYGYGRGCDVDEARMDACYKILEAENYAPALYCLGMSNDPGAFCHSPEKLIAYEFYDRAARQDYAPALLQMARKVLAGGYSHSDDESLQCWKLLERAVELGYTPAYCELAAYTADASGLSEVKECKAEKKSVYSMGTVFSPRGKSGVELQSDTSPLQPRKRQA